MSIGPLHLAILVGSTREGRFGPVPAAWIAGLAAQRSDFEVDLVDIADLDLPPTLIRRPHDAVDRFRHRIDRADAFVVVTPEYNHGYPAPLKHAIDTVSREWYAKPVGFVCYGGMSGGLRAVEQLRQVFAEQHAVTIRDTVSFHGARSTFDETGEPVDTAGARAAAKVMLDELAWWAHALRTARAADPYVA